MIFFENLGSDSDADEESDTKKQLSTTRRNTVRLENDPERLIDIETSNEQKRNEGSLETRTSLMCVESSEEYEEPIPGVTASSPGMSKDGLRRSGRVRADPHRCSGLDCSK